MCDFFTFCSDPTKSIPERFLFFDWPNRQNIIADKLKYEADSHTSIADFYGYKGVAEDTLNKYEYNPLLGRFKVDQINNVNDAVEAEAWVRALDFKRVIAPLVIKPIINPSKMAPPEITSEVLELLRQWDSVRASVGDSMWASMRDSVGYSVRDSVEASVGYGVWASVWDSVRDSVGDSMWASMRDSVGYSVRDSVEASVWDSVRDSVGASVGDSVRDSVGAYLSSFFSIKYKFDFSPTVKLWEMGLVPSFDGKKWRLHGKEKAEILWEGEITP
jgi:hypothetical protein